MSKNDTPSTPRPSREQKGYQPKPITEGYKPNPQGGHQPATGEGAPSRPPSNPPDQGSGGKK